MQKESATAREAGFASVDAYYQHEMGQVANPQSFKSALNAARKKVTDAEDQQTRLQEQVNALPTVRQAAKRVSRTLNITFPNGQTNYYVQTTMIHGQAQILNGQITYSDWGTAEWPEYTPVVIPGYVATTAPAMTVDKDTPEQQFALTYQAQPTTGSHDGAGKQNDNLNQGDTPTPDGRITGHNGTGTSADGKAKKLPLALDGRLMAGHRQTYQVVSYGKIGTAPGKMHNYHKLVAMPRPSRYWPWRFPLVWQCLG